MKDLSDKFLMMLEPRKRAQKPINDELTSLARKVLRMAKAGEHYKGCHECICGVCSSNRKMTLPDGRETNSLLVHYVRCHRDEIPKSEIAKLREYKKHE